MDSVGPEQTPPHIGLERERWSVPALLMFRWAVLYAVIQWMPYFVQSMTFTLSWGTVQGPDWWSNVTNALGQWVILHVLGLPPHSPPRLTSNNLTFFLGMMTSAAVAIVGAVLWSLVDRRSTGYPRLFAGLHTVVRFMLAIVMLRFGVAKLLPIQFVLTLDYLTIEVGDHNTRDLLWAFMGASRQYQLFAGVLETAGGLFLLSRRTMFLGAVLSVASMANVLAMNIAYGVPAKFMSAQVFLLSVFALAPFVPPLWRQIVQNRPTHPVTIVRLIPESAAGRFLVGALSMWILFGVFLEMRGQLAATLEAKSTPLYGVWDVEQITKNDTSVPLLASDPTLWRRLVVQSKNAAAIIPMVRPIESLRPVGRYSLKHDSSTRTVQLTPYAFSGTSAGLTFGYELPDSDHLVLTDRRNPAEITVVRLRRFNPQSYTLLAPDNAWRW